MGKRPEAKIYPIHRQWLTVWPNDQGLERTGWRDWGQGGLGKTCVGGSLRRAYSVRILGPTQMLTKERSLHGSGPWWSQQQSWALSAKAVGGRGL